MRHSRLRALFALVALCLLAEPVLAFTTTYYWAASGDGSGRVDPIWYGCTQAEPPSFPAMDSGSSVPAPCLRNSASPSSTTSGSGTTTLTTVIRTGIQQGAAQRTLIRS